LRIDTQVHVVSRELDHYPLNPPEMGVPRWFEQYGRTAEELLSEMDSAGIDRAVLVQGFSAYQYDNRYTADSATHHPDRFVSSCIVDLRAGAIEQIRHWVENRGARSIRLFVQLGGDDWLRSPDCDQVFAELRALGVIAQTAVVAAQLPALLPVAQRHPDVPVVVDHCGFPDFAGGDDFPNAASLFALAAAPNVHVKLSTHVFDLAQSADVTPRAVTNRIVDAFSANRVMWASDLTVSERTYEELLATAEDACSDLSDADRDLVLGEAACRVWWS
jgi:predicted TIM-barrel fold metal-dependent hydrolase